MGQKKRKKQAELIQELTDQELVWNVVASQLIFLFLAAIASFFLFSWNELFGLFDFQWMEIFLYGLIPGTVVVIIDLLLIRFVPKKHWDDGGVNEKIFRSLNAGQIFLLATVIGVSEEFLFRGVIHTELGYIVASSIFALVHVRYLRKPVLLVSVILLSFLIGYMYEITGNLLVPIVAHIWIDFLLGIYYRYRLR
ncbi:CPBP family intramembrane glutamic endopeptidase [Allobacillus halotolerans]|uniref:CPBP family intramembrane metalloprotease n=1 Tax=Allobacillus halotolerans TaxID=570278 RepID=A0ABS6GLL0_9BACI|nr:type II CAAX endopeptidase family protein [Allobacillus halotolerans]MBU6079539.1 CPBP family intramembrane metalloprotease [Allobacillus halotolerans]